ncbi:KilA-N domain-containing protein [Chelatococcus asaccharovorans]|uniref:KilA domain-containing protein n=1 Tax=Chelatococcus asaccharovorans TaxID=28210 RepID=A0A2V3U375_9HYPH|nr:KilA-N domain-containing protein [Chelatococcus asaccharovorans]MBS7702695.1 KilA-N domain-containing protein [Chelatococcus asaccharovorans]PXW56989.1 KilA domain-containing protein [Chelatococcus asaccharovorans]
MTSELTSPNDGARDLPARLVYNGEVIRDKNEMLSLTDMWKAAGSVDGRRPDDWKKDAAHREFLDHVAMVLNAPVEGIWKGTRGRHNGGTMAHWQIALAYAKYLSPEFHMWCNSVVRERMEGRRQPGISAELADEITRSFGILRMLAHKVTVIENSLAPAQVDIQALVRSEMAAQNYILRRGRTAGQIWRDNKFPPLKNAASWFGNRLEKMGCRIADNGCGELGLSKARLFDPDKASNWLENGGLLIVQQKISERRGQGRLRLVGEVERVQP